jgi:hypothetical protein
MKMIPHHAEGQHIHPAKPRLFTQDFKKHPLRLIIKKELPTSRPTCNMIHPNLIPNQMSPPKTSPPHIAHKKKLRNHIHKANNK